MQTQTMLIKDELISQSFMDQLEEKMLAHPKCSRDMAELRTQHQEEKRAEVEKENTSLRNSIFEKQQYIKQLECEENKQQAKKEREVSNHQKTQAALKKTMTELVKYYQKDGDDWKRAWFRAYTESEQYAELQQFLDKHQDVLGGFTAHKKQK